MRFDAIVVGGGAAGLLSAVQAGKRGRSVLVIEHNAEVGRKILISGGGRCNFTNVGTAPENFISQNPHFCKSALSRYTPEDFISLVRKHRIPHYEKTLGQLFCRESSRAIVDMLLKECSRARVTINTRCSISSVRRDEQFVLETNLGEMIADKLVIASGGLSFAKIGATDLGYRVARQFGLKIVETRPSLVALVIKGQPFPELAGISADTVVTAGKNSFRENILFTHRGLSGPAVLQISNYWKKGSSVSIDLAPGRDMSRELTIRSHSRQSLGNFLSEMLPGRIAQRLVQTPDTKTQLANLSARQKQAIASRINNWQVEFKETEGYDRAEVTLGGVSTAEISSQTFEVKKVPGLYFIGEVLDVTGWLGGYNFQWAWASGFAAGNAI